MLSCIVLYLVSLSHNLLGEELKTTVEHLSVVSQRERLPTQPGSSHLLTEADLQDFGFNDIHRVLRSVPGVNIQEEDGYGLRPNIGIRGAHPHRSKGITLLEDGILIAPAPYAAPAAYYVPQLDKIGGIEIFKGVPSTRYGPNSIGGAINFLSRTNPTGAQAAISTGSFGFEKYDLHMGVPLFGHLSLDFNHMSTEGFKELDGGGDTGFRRQNIQARWDKELNYLEQKFLLKFNLSEEDSDETYVGLTSDDFSNNPYRRYSSTALDYLEWQHQQLLASYSLSPWQGFTWNSSYYNHEMKRDWFKLNGFYNQGSDLPPNLRQIFQNPQAAANNYFYRVLSGQANSGVLSDNRDLLDIGGNNRNYYSQGLQTQIRYEMNSAQASHVVLASYRNHTDRVERNHQSSFFDMINGSLTRSQLNDTVTVLNQSKAMAQTLSLSYEGVFDKLNYTTIIRYEDISYEQQNRLNGSTELSTDHMFAPGAGFYYQAFDQLGFLAGVNKGFTPKGPGQESHIQPEQAINYEMGLRYTGAFSAEMIGFYSDYTNMLGTCSLSNGCNPEQIDTSFNGGEAKVAGIELLFRHEWQKDSWIFPILLSATYTEAHFKNSFTSGLAEWGFGDVLSGDPIPYIPRWQGVLGFGMQRKCLYADLRLNYQSDTFDQAVQTGREIIPARWITDLIIGYHLSKKTRLSLRVDNLTNEKYVVSLRPFGLRPGLPQSFIVGVKHDFF
jgi:Fe(3+) dicitrate transport protein